MSTQRHQDYLAKANAVGVSVEVAEAELAAVSAELFNPFIAITSGRDEAYEIAWRRLISGGPQCRPSDEVRAALRRAYPNAHPEQIDQLALQLAPGETVAKALFGGSDEHLP